MKNKYKVLLIALLLPVLTFAQANPDYVSDTASVIPNAGHYIVGLIAGIILAVAFQLILTNLSVAAGLNVLSSATSTSGKGRGGGSTVSVTGGGSDQTVGETVRTVSSAFGVWALVTASIALFFASWLAAELSLTANRTVGAVMGLVIWGLFYVAMMTIEVSAVSSLVGSLVRLAATGLRSAYNMTASIFTKSDEDKMADTAAKVAGAVREEIFGDTDADDIKDQIQKYINQLKPQRIDPQEFAMEFAKLLDNTELRAISSHEGPFIDSETVVASLKTKGYTESTARSIASNLGNVISKMKEESSKDKDTVSKVADAGMRAAGMSSQEAENVRMQMESYLRDTGKEELNPDAIKRDLQRVFTDPKGATASLKDRLSHIDKETIASMIAQRQDISQEEAQKIVDSVYSTITGLTSSVSNVKDTITEKLQTYLNSIDRPELDYEGISHDLQRVFQDPKAGTEALMRRIKSVDRDTIKSLLASREDISEEDAERIISKVEMARDSVMQKVDQMKHEIDRRMNEVKQEAIHQADEVRKTASTAAWWAFASAVVSGIFAAIGGMMAV